MYEDSGNINAIGTRHTVFAVVTWYILQSDDLMGNLIVQIFHLLVRERHQRAVTKQVVLQMFHIGHAAQYRQHTFRGTGIAEGPRSHRPLWGMTLQLGHQILRQVCQTTS